MQKFSDVITGAPPGYEEDAAYDTDYDPVDDQFMATFVQPAEGDLDEMEDLETAAKSTVSPGGVHNQLSPRPPTPPKPSSHPIPPPPPKTVKSHDGDDVESSLVDGESASLSYDSASAYVRDALSAHTGPNSVAFLELGSTGDVGITEQKPADFADAVAVASNYDFDDDKSGSFAPPPGSIKSTAVAPALALGGSIGPARSWKTNVGDNELSSPSLSIDIQYPHPYFDDNVDNDEKNKNTGKNTGASEAVGVAAMAAGARVLRLFCRSNEEDDQDPDAFDAWDISDTDGQTPGGGEGENADFNPGQSQ